VEVTAIIIPRGRGRGGGCRPGINATGFRPFPTSTISAPLSDLLHFSVNQVIVCSRPCTEIVNVTDPYVTERHVNLNIHLAFETLEPGNGVFSESFDLVA